MPNFLKRLHEVSTIPDAGDPLGFCEAHEEYIVHRMSLAAMDRKKVDQDSDEYIEAAQSVEHWQRVALSTPAEGSANILDKVAMFEAEFLGRHNYVGGKIEPSLVRYFGSLKADILTAMQD